MLFRWSHQSRCLRAKQYQKYRCHENFEEAEDLLAMGDMDDKAEDGEKCRNGQNEKECESNFTVALPFLLQKRNTDPADDWTSRPGRKVCELAGYRRSSTSGREGNRWKERKRDWEWEGEMREMKNNPQQAQMQTETRIWSREGRFCIQTLFSLVSDGWGSKDFEAGWSKLPKSPFKASLRWQYRFMLECYR